MEQFKLNGKLRLLDLQKFNNIFLKAKHRLFIALVVVPTLISALYFGAIASNIYISESRIIVRSQNKDSTPTFGSGISGIVGKIGINNSENDSFTAENYIQSRAALEGLNSRLDLIAAYSSSSIDRYHRFAGIRFWDKSFEAFYEYYLKDIVGVSHDPDSGITILSIRAFNPQLAYQMNLQLIEQSESLVNRLNLRARQDMLAFAQKEVELAKEKVEISNQKIYQFRTQKQSGSSEQQITTYQQLVNEKDFADRNLTAALASLEQARIEAIKKQLYLERVAEPNTPDMAIEPRRIRGILTTFMLGLLFWGIATMMIAGVREHQHHG